MTDKEKIRFINDVINFWEDDTIMLSNIDQKHPAFSLITKIDPQIVIPIILKRINKKITWLFVILYTIVPKEEQPDLPEEFRGKIKNQTNMWLKWGRKKGYLK